MISDKSGLSNRLGWVLDETEQMLERVRQLFADYSGDRDQAVLDQALNLSKDVLGILDILDTEGAYMLNREVVLLMDAMRQDEVDSPDEAAGVCADGLLQLSEYLKHLHDGYADLPVIILPMLNNLRAARKADLLSEHLVFLPAEGSITNQHIGTEKYVELPAVKKQEALQRLRFYMQKSLLGWYNNDRPETHLQAGRKVVANLLVMNRDMRSRSLWWVTGALLQALEQNKLESSAAIKMLMGRMEREIKRFSEYDEVSYNNFLPEELLKNLLYYVGLAEEGEGQLQAVKSAYHLDLYLPKGETLEELRSYYLVPGRELWHSVAASMEDELSLLMSQVEGLSGRAETGPLMKDIGDRTQSLARALGMLGLGKAAALTEVLSKQQQAVSKQSGEIEQLLLEGMSEHYVRLEKLLTEYAETGHDRTEEIFSDDMVLADPGASREVIRSVLNDVSKVQSELGLFAQSTSEFAPIESSVKLLHSAHGAVDVLGFGELQPLIEGTKNYLQLDILQNQRQPDNGELSCLADIVTLLEASLSCIEQQDDYLPLLPAGYEKLRELDGECAIDLLGPIDMEAANDELNIKKSTADGFGNAASEDTQSAPVDWLVSGADETETVLKSGPESGAEPESDAENPQTAEYSEGETSFAASVDAEIYEIFVEEINEILDNFKIWIPQWVNERDNTELLREIRRAYHTCKGSGRMVGGLAIGDYAWVHEDMLNQVLEGQLPRNDNLAAVLQQSLTYLHERQNFFLNAEQIDEPGREEIRRVEAFIIHPEQAVESDTVETDALEPVDLIAVEQADLAVDLPAGDEQTPEVEESSASDEETVPETAIPAIEFTPLEAQPGAGLSEISWSDETITTPETVKEVPTAPEELPAPAEAASIPVPSPEQVDELEEQRIVWAMFKEELPDQLLSLDQQMQQLTANPQHGETLKELERELHTLKGSSRMAQLSDMGDLAHQAEELLEQIRRERGRVISSAELSELQGQIDQISALGEQYAAMDLPVMLREPAASEAETKPEMKERVEVSATPALTQPVIAPDTAYQSYLEQVLTEQAESLPDLSVLKEIDAFSEEQRAGTETPSVPLSAADQEQIRLSAGYIDRMISNANTLNVQQNTLREQVMLMGEDVGEFGRTTSRLKQLLRSLELETETQIHAGHRLRGGQKHESGFDPLEMDEYSEIQRLSRALAESLNDLVNIEGDLSLQLRTIDQLTSESLQTGRELHQGLLNTRLVEVAVIVPRLRRIMRQIAAEFGRVVSFEVDGESLKLDRHLLQQMTAPIEHILRNAVFHGIEPPEEREAEGKAKDGGVLLEVSREDTEVVVRISDDGRGLDKEKIQRKAVEAGLIRADEKLSDQDIYKLVLHSGFTTVDEANQVAGRGVGMDVVNSEIKALGGSLLIDSVAGAGCEFTLRLPFTMVANPVLFVNIQKQHYALPLSGIQGLTRHNTGVIRHHLMNKESPLMLNNQPYVLHYLGAALGHPAEPELRDGDMHVVIYMRTGESHIAWLVDAINGRRDVVLQSLGALFKNCRFYSAATVTSDGEVVMVPDMLELTGRMMLKQNIAGKTAISDNQQQEQSVRPVQHEHPHILVVDDSVTVRKVTEKFLLNKNFVVETAKDGLEALEKLDNFEVDLILLDIEMPRMDGFEVLSAVRMEPRWQHLPVIMISSRTAEKHMEHAKALGATDFLGKPYQNQVLLKYIDQHLQAQHPQSTESIQSEEELAV